MSDAAARLGGRPSSGGGRRWFGSGHGCGYGFGSPPMDIDGRAFDGLGAGERAGQRPRSGCGHGFGSPHRDAAAMSAQTSSARRPVLLASGTEVVGTRRGARCAGAWCTGGRARTRRRWRRTTPTPPRAVSMPSAPRRVVRDTPRPVVTFVVRLVLTLSLMFDHAGAGWGRSWGLVWGRSWGRSAVTLTHMPPVHGSRSQGRGEALIWRAGPGRDYAGTGPASLGGVSRADASC